MANNKESQLSKFPTEDKEVGRYICKLIQKCEDPCQLETTIKELKFSEAVHRKEWIELQKKNTKGHPVKEDDNYLYHHIHFLCKSFNKFVHYADSPENKIYSDEYLSIAKSEV